ncbi:hypothetical protein [Candidatus Gromoviella agglomerans]|uniref:hypothetical protein n=1 Tax=Candidatus Gromoviella agglomerans TaxID=2806609 RepID=UPI001E2ED79A|nr:hypothetical protein [Candidatus Gromoviella agglomerans]UFX98144.1 hypothetical protein Gromo_00023 [Candidatus Gromoviella agglomerans]
MNILNVLHDYVYNTRNVLQKTILIIVISLTTTCSIVYSMNSEHDEDHNSESRVSVTQKKDPKKIYFCSQSVKKFLDQHKIKEHKKRELINQAKKLDMNLVKAITESNEDCCKNCCSCCPCCSLDCCRDYFCRPLLVMIIMTTFAIVLYMATNNSTQDIISQAIDGIRNSTKRI